MKEENKPIVTTTLNKPLAIRSISCSICCSVEEGELRMSYAYPGFGGSACGEGEGGLTTTGGTSEKSEGEGDINDKYWSNI
jgi:hypothetical protein